MNSARFVLGFFAIYQRLQPKTSTPGTNGKPVTARGLGKTTEVLTILVAKLQAVLSRLVGPRFARFGLHELLNTLTPRGTPSNNIIFTLR